MSRSSDAERRAVLIDGFDERARYFSHADWLRDPRLAEGAIALLGLSGQETIVELGIGTGHLASKIMPLVRHFIGVDLSSAMLSKAAEAVPKSHLLRYDCEALPDLFLEDTFDVVVSRNLLHHVSIPAVLRSAHHVLKPGGRFLLVEASVLDQADSTFFFEFAELLHPGHVSYPSHKELLLHIAQSGFRLTHQEQIERNSALTGYLSSIAGDQMKKERIVGHFASAPAAIRARYRLQGSGGDLAFSAFWSIIVARKENILGGR